MSKFYYFQSSKNSKWYFHLKENNKKIILSSSQGYSTRVGCLKGIASVKRYGRHERNYTLFKGRDRKFYFNIRSRNGKCIGKSESYEAKYNCTRGLRNCITEAQQAAIVRSPVR
jgi:uncharacterized protein YegP (UPF0339 family)